MLEQGDGATEQGKQEQNAWQLIQEGQARTKESSDEQGGEAPGGQASDEGAPVLVSKQGEGEQAGAQTTHETEGKGQPEGFEPQERAEGGAAVEAEHDKQVGEAAVDDKQPEADGAALPENGLKGGSGGG